MVSTTATETANRRQRRRPDTPVAAGVLEWTSHRGLHASAYTARCTGCGEQRLFTRPGERLCPCGQRLRLVVTAEVA